MSLQRPVFLALSVALVTSTSESYAHPSSGIVIDESGQVFFGDLTRGLMKIDVQGKVTSIHREGGHWMAFDPQGTFSRMQFAASDHWPRWFKRRTPEGVAPAIITDGGSPLVVGRDGNLYYVCDDDKFVPAGLQIARLSPDGKLALLNPQLRDVGERLRGIRGLAFGPEGVLYAAYAKAILKIDLRGTATTLVNPVVITDCDLRAPKDDAPWLRGLAVDEDRSVYAAATGCGCVIKVAANGAVSTVLKAEKPWAPCGVALHHGDLYVLEHINPNSAMHEDWPPRVRKLAKDGQVTTLFTAADAGAPPGAKSDGTGALLVPAPGSPIAATSGGDALIAGDINGDSCADLVLTAGKWLNVTFGGGSRVWSAKPDVEFELQSPASEIALGDVNRDGKQDLVLADHDSYDVAVLLGSGDGRFQPAEGSPFSAREGNQPHTHGLVVADFNGDGHLDIATANHSDGDISLLLGNGKGKFVRAGKSPFACGKSPYPIATADITGDGHVDLLIPNAVHGEKEVKTLTILLGDGKGGLTSAVNSPLVCDATLWYVATGDLNGDGRPDVVATHSEGGSAATILLNAGQGKLSPAPGSPLSLGHGAWGAEIADMDRDGNADLVVAADEHIRIFLGDGRGSFKPAAGSPFPTGKGAWRLTVGDFNGDRKLDVASRCVEANEIAILYGN